MKNVENLIIGSGYRGAVTALKLTETHKKVTLLEMGIDFEKRIEYKPFSNMVIPSSNSIWLRNKTIAPMMNMVRLNNSLQGY